MISKIAQLPVIQLFHSNALTVHAFPALNFTHLSSLQIVEVFPVRRGIHADTIGTAVCTPSACLTIFFQPKQTRGQETT
jgi:hypothetical protein